MQALTLNGEPRMIVPIHAASGLCGICSDGRRVFVSDMDLHKVHVLTLTNERRRAVHAARDRQEALQRESLRAGTGVAGARRREDDRPSTAASIRDAEEHAAIDEAVAHERRVKEVQRDLALRRAGSAPPGAPLLRVLGLRAHAPKADVMQAVRLALRLLHPDRSMNIPLRGSAKGQQLEAAFKRINALKDDVLG